MRLHRTKMKPSPVVSPPKTEKSEENAMSDPPDLSILRKSIATSVTSFAHARNIFDTGSHELKQLLSTECDIIYECRVCRNLFRSIANFISHKRAYCCEKFNSSLHPHFSNNNIKKEDMITMLKNEDDYQDFIKNNDKNLSVSKIEENNKKYALSKDLTSVIERLLHRNRSEASSNLIDKRHTKFQSIPHSDSAVYQNVVSNKATSHESIKDQVAELDRMISSNEAVLGPDGKLISCQSSPESSIASPQKDEFSAEHIHKDLFCELCKIKFSSLKTKKFHFKHKHSSNRLVFPCTECADTFANSWSVLRHLIKVHRKTATHMKKLRGTVHSKAYVLTVPDNNVEEPKPADVATSLITEQQRLDQENQAWIENLEGDGDIPRCGGCGKRFERRAALSAHRQTCQLRKSAQNKINSNLHRKALSKNKEQEDSSLPEPSSKTVNPDLSSEKRIEIKIRKNYNKHGVPLALENSEFRNDNDDEDTVMDSLNMSDSNSKSDIGESDFTSSIGLLNNLFINDESDSPNVVKDYDDANVDFISAKTPSVKSGETIDHIMEIVNGDIDFDDAKQTSHNELSKANTKACGQSSVNPKRRRKKPLVKTEDYDSINEMINNENLLNSSYEETEYAKYECMYCSVKFVELDKYEKHVSRHLIWKRFECKVCGIKSCNSSQYEKHMKLHETNDPSFSLDFVPESTSISDDIDISNVKVEVNVDSESSKQSFEMTKSEPKVKIRNKNPNQKKNKNKIQKQLKTKKPSVKKQLSIQKIKEEPSQTPELPPSPLMTSPAESTQDIFIICKSEPLDEDSNLLDLDLEESKKITRVKRKRNSQQVASSESNTVQRPVRNRIKNMDKDFEYDSSYFPKTKQNRKETGITTSKIQVKPKQFLQSDPMVEDVFKSWQEMDQTVTEKEKVISPIAHLASLQTVVIKEEPAHQGALQAISAKAAAQGRCQMKMTQAVIARRNTLPFVRSPYRAVPCPEEIPTETGALSISSHLGADTTAVPLMTSYPEKVVQTSSTVSKTSKKSYSGKTYQRKQSKSPPKPTSTTPKYDKVKTFSANRAIQKKKQSPKLSAKTMSLSKIDHQALKKVSCCSGEITMISKSLLKPFSERSSSPSGDTLSILPSNDKNSSFVNISLKELKNLQKSDNIIDETEKHSGDKTSFSLKNLEENNEIKISKISSDETYNRQGNPSLSKDDKESIHKSIKKIFDSSIKKHGDKSGVQRKKTPATKSDPNCSKSESSETAVPSNAAERRFSEDSSHVSEGGSRPKKYNDPLSQIAEKLSNTINRLTADISGEFLHNIENGA